MRILLAEHHSQVLKALRTLLKEKTEYTLVGEAIDTESLLDQAQEISPDLVLFAWDLPGRPSTEIIAALNALDPRPKVVVISGQLDVEEIAHLAGADVFVSKSDPPHNLLDALQLMQMEINEQKTKNAGEPDTSHQPSTQRK